MDAFIRDVLKDTDNLPNEERPRVIDVYCGNIHISPLSRLWNTTTVLEQDSIKIKKQNHLAEEEHDSEKQ